MEIDMKSKCRGCLSDEGNMTSLFEDVNSLEIRENIMSCARIQIAENDGGPTNICRTCLHELSMSIKFREKCELSDKKIKSIIGLSHEKEIQRENKIVNGKYSNCLNIKEEIHNNDDNSYDFFDNTLNLKNELLDDLKIEFINDEGHLDSNSSNKVDIMKYEDAFLMKRKKKKNKLKKKECVGHVKEATAPRKRGRKPKILPTLEYNQNEELIKVFNDELQCSVCQKTFVDAKSYKIHIKIHSKTRDHTCDQCGKQFKYKDNLKVHYMTHSGEKPFKCDLCDKSFSKKDNLGIHRRRHLKERTHSCHECGAAYYTSYELKTHMRSHTGEKPHVCTLCGKRFTAKNNLYIHQRSHTGEKPHVCTVCGKQFTSKNILSIHSRTHTGEKPYICSVCGKRFTANKLAVHMRTHTGEKPHVCPLCGKQFSASNVLVIHMRRHTGEKPYECRLCGQTYGHTQSLNKHMRKQHKIVTNAVQLHMQQINEAHRALLEGKTTVDGVSKDTEAMQSKVVSQQPANSDSTLAVEDQSTDLVNTNLSQEMLKIV